MMKLSTFKRIQYEEKTKKKYFPEIKEKRK